jgi:hypothetical protein
MSHVFSDGPEAVARRLISWAAEEGRMKRPDARREVARQAGIAPGSLERLQNGRLKFTERIAGRLNDLLARTIERKITSLEHELWLARQANRRIDPTDLDRAAAALVEAKRALGKG